MPANSYPVVADLTAYLTSAGLTVDEVQVASAVTAGIAAFERDTGRVMLAPVTPATRTFDPPDTGKVLEFAADVLTVTAVTYQPQGASVQTFVAATDYRLGPPNAEAKGLPWEWLELRCHWWSPHYWGAGRSISVTGRWGYGVAIPDDAWQAMLLGGFLSLVFPAALRATGFTRGWKEGDVSEDFGTDVVRGYAEGAVSMYQTVVNRYRRLTV
jgi:hypothetical protein